MTQKIIISLCITLAAGLLFVNLYSSLVDAKSWASNIPRSAEVAREYFGTVNPGHFFRIFSPINQLLGLILLIACWKFGKEVRVYCAIAFVFALIAEGMTFKYFYPRNEIIFNKEPFDLAAVQQAVKQWSSMNWVRTLFILAQVVTYFVILQFIYTRQPA